ncbi:MAG: MFS transporter [Clostridia bacterium]
MVIQEKKKDKRKRTKKAIRRQNAKLYPFYKMLSWDLLCFYSIEFLFYTITKQISASEVLITSALYQIFIIVMYIPAVTITDLLGRKKGIIIGNTLIVLFLICLMVLPGMISIILANLIFALGYNMKSIAESNLLYDSVATKGGDGLYSKLEAKGGSLYYLFDGIASLLAGYLFVIHNYLPILICLLFAVISMILAFQFEEVYPVETTKVKTNLWKTVKAYTKDLKQSCHFILKSKRMKSFILFGAVFTGIITIVDTCRGDLLTDLGIGPEQFSAIFAILIFIGGISIRLKERIEKKFKNRSLTVLSLTYILACIAIGAVTLNVTNQMVVPIVLLLYTFQYICTSNWYILEEKYGKNFTKPEKRNQITFTYEFVGAILSSMLALGGSVLLDHTNASVTFLLCGLAFLALMICILDYMSSRFGLKPEQYRKEDIDF